MKKKVFSLLLVLCLGATAILMGGCQKNLNFKEYSDYSEKALINTYNYVLTEKDDLSTHGDFTYTETSVLKSYEEDILIGQTTTKETHQRKGKEADTVYVVTTENETKTYNKVTEEYEVETTKTVDIYTKIVTADVTTYHRLREYTNAEGEVDKYVYTTYLSEELYVAAIYDLSEEIMDEISEAHPDGEIVLYTTIGEFEAKGDKEKGSAKISFDITSYDSYSKAVEKQEMSACYSYEDAKLIGGESSTKMYENGKLASESDKNVNISYSCDVTVPTSIEAYL